nr:hypothetical protein [uncultured Cohaesibacter sp.]
MRNLGFFEEYTPQPSSPELVRLGVRFSQNEDGVDWYDLNGLIGSVVLLGADDVVNCVADDATGCFPADQTVIELEEGDIAPEMGEVWDGVSFSAPIPKQADYTNAIQAMLDAAANTRLYDSAATMSTYVSSNNTEWAAEAAAMIAWRDAVWLYAYEQLDLVQSGQRSQPTVDELLAELPTPTWPA